MAVENNTRASMANQVWPGHGAMRVQKKKKKKDVNHLIYMIQIKEGVTEGI